MSEQHDRLGSSRQRLPSSPRRTPCCWQRPAKDAFLESVGRAAPALGAVVEACAALEEAARAHAEQRAGLANVRRPGRSAGAVARDGLGKIRSHGASIDAHSFVVRDLVDEVVRWLDWSTRRRALNLTCRTGPHMVTDASWSALLLTCSSAFNATPHGSVTLTVRTEGTRCGSVHMGLGIRRRSWSTSSTVLRDERRRTRPLEGSASSWRWLARTADAGGDVRSPAR